MAAADVQQQLLITEGERHCKCSPVRQVMDYIIQMRTVAPHCILCLLLIAASGFCIALPASAADDTESIRIVDGSLKAEWTDQLSDLGLRFPHNAEELPDRLITLFQRKLEDDYATSVVSAQSRDLFNAYYEAAVADADLWQLDNNYRPDRSSAMLWLLMNAPPIDMLELDKALLDENLALAFEAAEQYEYDPGSDFFRRYVLNYRLDDEPVSAWRSELKARYPIALGRGVAVEELIRDIAIRVGEGFTLQERGYFGNQADPLSIDNARVGTKSEFALLLAAVLRSAGFATRFVREGRTGESWVEVHIGEKGWQPLYPAQPEKSFDSFHADELCGGRITVVTAGDAFGREQVTARYSSTGQVIPVIERNNAVLEGYEHFSISAWHEGRWVPLDDLEYPLSALDYPLGRAEAEGPEGGDEGFWLGPGDYRLTAGARYPGGYVQVATQDFQVSDRYLAQPSVDLTAPPEIPAEALIELRLDPQRFTGELAWLSEGVRLVMIGDDSEPSVRAKEIFDGLELPVERKLYYTAAGLAAASAPEPGGSASASLVEALGYSADNAMPIQILLRDGETLLYLRGYNLNAGEWILRALE